jgi:parallel beta-helix repeat protein
MRSRPSFLVTPSLALLCLLAYGAGGAHGGQVCDKTAKRGKSPRQFVRSLSPGMTACFAPGTYSSRSHEITVEVPRVTLMSEPHARRARIGGRLRIARGANRVTVRRLRLDGRNLGGKASPVVNAKHATFARNHVTNHHTGICFLLGNDSYGHAYRTVIRRNRIHDCGRLPATNRDHGIYVAHASGTRIQRNWIYDNADRGIQLYPNATDSLITGNVIDGNGQGLNFSCDDSSCSRRNVVEGNVISNSVASWNVYGNSGGATPYGSNVLRGNCVWASNSDPYYSRKGGVDSDPDFFSEWGNLVAPPKYVNRTRKDFRLRPHSPCRAILR